MKNNADFCFSAAVLSGVDAVDLATAFGVDIVDNDENLFDDATTDLMVMVDDVEAEHARMIDKFWANR